MVFTGDIQQIDSPYLDAQSNGLAYMVDKMKGQELFAHINLIKGERSQLSELASDGDLGVTYKKDTETDFPARNTVKEVYTWLVEDLERAKGLMSDDYNAKINYRLNKKSVCAILARVYLTMGENQLAVTNATAAITGDGSDMADTQGFSKVYTTSMAVPEVLFRIALKSDDGILPGNSWGQGATTS